MKNPIMRFLTEVKNDNPYLKYLWLLSLERREKKELANFSDVECINNLYYSYVHKYPNYDNPVGFGEKMQWMKLHYRNELMPVVGDKYTVRKYLEELGHPELLNELIAVYDSIEQFEVDKLPKQFVLKATHSSGWNLVVKDKDKVNWRIWKKHMQFWLTHGIEWNGREWHYGEMTPRIVCEKYLEDKSGGLMDYKFFCFDGEPKFLQVNVDRGLPTATQNYYDLDWKLIPFGKSQPHNPNIEVECPSQFQHMIQLAKELSQPFPYVRVDFYEANDKIYFGEFTFFPCSGMPDFIPIEYDKIVGDMLKLPKANH